MWPIRAECVRRDMLYGMSGRSQRGYCGLLHFRARTKKNGRFTGRFSSRCLRCCSAVALTLSLSASVQGQPVRPRPHPEPSPAVAKRDRTPPALMPVETVWGLALNNALTAAPAYDGTTAFFPIEGDRLVAYDLIAGTQQWLVASRPLMDPVAGGGLLFLLEADTLRALRAVDGTAAWELPFADTLAVHPVWDNGWLIVALATGETRAYRATDGHLIWSRDLKSPAHALPSLAADRVYVPTRDGRIVALRVENGEPIWERRLGGAVNDILALDDRLYAGSQDNVFYCVMASDGRVDWHWKTGGDIIGRAVADNRLVYFVALDNVLRAMNLISGNQQWMRPLPLRPAWGPAKAGSAIIVAGPAPPLRAFDVKDGQAAGTLTGTGLGADAEAAAAPYVLEDPLRHVAMVLVLFKDIAKGATATLLMHSVEPALIDKVAPLPNLVQIAPDTPMTPPRP
jgi:outer membrane protein assembly factor BamB